MFSSFDQRSHELERLDTGDYTPREYALWQKEARYINRFLGDSRALRLSLRGALLGSSDRAISVLDVGAGSGELLKTARRSIGGGQAFLVGAEMNAEAAKAINVRFDEFGAFGVQCDALCLPFADDSFDVVISSLFLHHLKNEQAVKLISEMARVARNRFFIIDLHRHPIAYYFYHAFAGLFFQRFTVEDGSLSILRSFKPDEMRSLAAKASVRDFSVKRRAPFRLVLSGGKTSGTK